MPKKPVKPNRSKADQPETKRITPLDPEDEGHPDFSDSESVKRAPKPKKR